MKKKKKTHKQQQERDSRNELHLLAGNSFPSRSVGQQLFRSFCGVSLIG